MTARSKTRTLLAVGLSGDDASNGRGGLSHDWYEIINGQEGNEESPTGSRGVSEPADGRAQFDITDPSYSAARVATDRGGTASAILYLGLIGEN